MSSLLQGGDMRRKRRRRRGRRPAPRSRGRLGAGLVVLAVLVGAGVWLFAGLGDSGKSPQDVLAPPAGISLFGGPTVDVLFKVPPKAGLLFDVRTGQVLWSRHPLTPLPIASL